MADYTVKRRLYLGAGQWAEKGSTAPDMTPAERERLVASGAISKARSSVDSEGEAAPTDKPRARRKSS